MRTATAKPAKTHSPTFTRPGGFFRAAGSPGFFGPVMRKADADAAIGAKLPVSKPADPLEREANRTADQVMRVPAPQVQRTAGPATHVDAARIQRFGAGAPVVAANAQTEIQRAMTGGRALPSGVRSFMERRLGADLGDVRVHADESAHGLSNHLSASAFTYRNHVFFGRGRYQPDTDAGLHLLAHELTHTLQQGATVQRAVRPDVQHAAEVIRPPEVTASGSPPALQRLGVEDALGYFADEAYTIPGFRMLTLVLGFNPINGHSAPRTAAALLRALIELLPGGAVITRVLDNHGVINEAADWVERKVAALGDFGSMVVGAFRDFIDSLGWSDLGNPGGAWDRAKRIFTDAIGRLASFGASVVDELLGLVKQAMLRPLAALAQNTPGYGLLTAILGEDPITGEPVPRTADALIGGFMQLIGQEGVWQDIKRGNAVGRAFAWFNGALAGLMGFVRSIPGRLMRTLASLTFQDVVTVVGAFGKVGAAFLGLAAEFGAWAFRQVTGLLKVLFSVVAPGVMPYLAKAKASFQTILKNPIRFVGNLVRAGKLGFQRFAGNILKHLGTALIKWITGPLGEAGVYIPASFSLVEVIRLVMSVLGLTWQNIRTKLLGIIPEPVLAALEKTASVLVTLVTQGPAAAWEQIKDELTELKDQLVGQVTQMIRTEIVKAAVMKLVGMLNPAGAVIQAIIAIHNTVTFFIEKAHQIGAVVAAFIDSIAAIAAGQVEGAAKRVEATMANGLMVVLAFLAKFAGLGGIPAKLVGIVRRIRQPIDKALDRIVAWLGKMLDKLTGALGLDSRTAAEKERDVRLAKKDAQTLLSEPGANPPHVQAGLPRIKSKYKLTTIVLEQLGNNQFDVLVVINPDAKTNPTMLKPGPEGLVEGAFVEALGRVWRVYAAPDHEHVRLANVANLEKKTFSTPIFIQRLKAGEYRLTELRNKEDPSFMSKIREEHAQKTKTPGHKEMALERAIHWAKMFSVKQVHMDRQYRTISQYFRGTIVEQLRGDVVIVHATGRIDVEEIRSRTDRPAELKARNEKALALLPPALKGDVEVVKIPGVEYPEDRKRK